MKKIVLLILLSLFIGCGKSDNLPQDLSGWTVDSKPISISKISGKTDYYVDISKREGNKLLELRIKVSAQEQDALARGMTIQELFGKVEKEEKSKWRSLDEAKAHYQEKIKERDSSSGN